jgi:hypothetical protein
MGEVQDPLNSRTKSPVAALGALTTLALVLRLACWTGLIGSDDLGYSHFAQAMARGTYQLEPHHLAIRFGLLLPVAALYRVGGVSEWSTVSVPLLASVLSVPALALIGRKMFGWRVGLIAGLLYATFPVQLRYASILVPEPVAAFLVLVAVLCFVHADGRRPTLLCAAGLALGIAYLTKEPALFVAPALMLDAVARRQWRGAVLIALGVTTIVTIECAFYLAHGDLLFRPHAMAVHERSGMALAANETLAYRLFKSYPRMMLVPSVDFGLHSVACLAGAAAALVIGPVAGYRLALAWAVIPWLYLNFGTSSLTRYFALPVAPRYIEFVYPPLMLMTGVVLARAFAARARIGLPSGAALALVAAAGLASGLATQGQGYRASEMTVLREIARRTRQLPSANFRAEDPHWERAMRIFGASLLSEPSQRADFVIVPDPVGLPALQKDSSPAPANR